MVDLQTMVSVGTAILAGADPKILDVLGRMKAQGALSKQLVDTFGLARAQNMASDAHNVILQILDELTEEQREQVFLNMDTKLLPLIGGIKD